MCLEFAVLSSGSRANAIYVSDGATRILIDCGLSAREADRRLALLGIAPDSISAIVVTHEHSDHVAGIPVFVRRRPVTVYLNEGTLDGSAERLSECRMEHFSTGERFSIGGLSFEPFSIMHDANDPVGFRVQAADLVLGVATDLGHVTTLVREKLRGLDALILESNHDWDLLQAAPYPWDLKQRISGRTGHLRNEAACELVGEVGDPSRLQVLVGGHISEKANHPELVVDGFTAVAARVGLSATIVAASAHSATPLFSLGEGLQRRDLEPVARVGVGGA